jgi:gliding motility-associated-like protein
MNYIKLSVVVVAAFLFVNLSFSQPLTLNGTALTASGGGPSSCEAGGYKTLNSAGVSGSCVTFTTGSFQNGAIWACSPINLNQSFKMTFQINFGTNTAAGDGMAFLLQTEGVPQVIGGRGGGLGYAQGDGGGCQGAAGGCPITPSVAVEFDTWNNAPDGLNDLACNHSSIQRNGQMDAANSLVAPVCLLPGGVSVIDGLNHDVCITWDPALNRYSVSFDGAQIIQYNGNIRTVFADPSNVFWGFTGASGGGAQTQRICNAQLLTNIASPSCAPCTPPVATATPASQTICSGTATSIALSSSISGTTYSWTVVQSGVTGASAGSGATINQTLTTTGTTAGTATYTITPTAAGCVGTPITVVITVNPRPIMTSASTATICSGQTVSIPLTSNPTGSTFTWIATDNTNVTGESLTTQTSSTLSNTLTNTTSTVQTVSYTVTPTLNGCVGTAQTVTVSVNPIPTVVDPADQTLCANTATTAVTFTGNNASTVYNWTNNTTSIGLAASGTGNIASFTATNTGSTAVTATITVTPTLNGCTGTAQTFTITVNPVPTVVDPADQTLCAGATTAAVTFTGNSASTTYNWTNNNTTIGLVASGTGNIAAFTTINTGSTPQVATITVTPTLNGCTGTPQTFTITVNPIPTVLDPADQTLCANTATTAVTFTGNNASTVYNWTNNTTSIGLAASGTGNIASFTATNTGSTAVTATITVTPTLNGCTGTAQTFTITVNPVPTVVDPADQTLCAGVSTTAVTFTGNSASTTYNWTNNNTSIGLAASGTGNIAAFTTINTGSTPQVATITVTPTLNGCTGTPQTFTITVNPIPTVLDPTDQTLCANTATTAVTFTGNNASTVYNWTNNTTSIGLAASGTGNIASFTATNTGSTAVTATVTVTPTLNGCTGTPQTFTITVNPVPTVVDPADQLLCAGENTAAVTFTGNSASTTYNWTNDNTTIGLAASGTGNIASFTTVNTGTTNQVATITVTPVLGSCTGTAQTFTITVRPLPTVVDPADQTLCANTATTTVTFSGNIGLTTYSWTNDNTSIGLAASGTGTINSFTALNAGTTTQVATITVTPSFNGCTGTAQTFTITVNPIPVIELTPTPLSACNATDGEIEVSLLSGPTSSGTVNWTGTTVGTSGLTTLPYDILNLGAGNYNVSFTDANGCISATVVSVLNNPGAPIINAIDNYVACNVPFTLLLSNITGSGLTGNQGYFSGPNGSGIQYADGHVFPVGTNNVQVYAYDVFGLCAAQISFFVTVNANPTASISPDPATVCEGASIALNGNPTGGSGVYSHAWTGDVSVLNVTSVVNPSTLTTAFFGTYNLTYTVTDDNGCVGTDNIAVSVIQTPGLPTVSTTAPTCAGNGTATITNYDNTLTYILTPAGPTAGAGGVISGMTPGTSYTVIADNGSCESAASTSFTIAAQLSVPVIPTLSTTAPTCSGNGTATITNYDNTLTYLFTPAGPAAGSGGVISGMTLGTSYTVIADNGSCESAASTSFSIAAQLTVPSIPTVSTTAPTCSGNGTATITNYDNTLTYIFTPAGPTAGAGGVISGMTPGTSYTVIADNGSCESAASTSFTIAAQLSVPVIPTLSTTAPTCSGNGTATITNYDNTLTYLFTPAGPAAGSGGVISGMTLGTSYTVIADNGSCASAASTSFNIAAQLSVPVIPTLSTTAPTCSGNGTATITNYDNTLTYIFTPAGPTAGVGGVISGMTFGTSYTVIADNGSCASAASTSFTIAAQLSVPVIPTLSTTAPTCSGNGTATITNYDNTLTYLFTPAGPAAGSGGVISGMTLGTSYTVIADNGSCASAESTSFTIAAQLSVPAIATVSTTTPTCAGNGTATITNYDNTLTYIFTPAGPTAGVGGVISVMTFGTNYTVIADNGSCASAASASFSIAAQLTIPDAPMAGNDSTYCSAWTLVPMTATGTGGTMTWYSSTGSVLGTGNSFTPLSGEGTTLYYVTETLLGCEGPSSEVMITINVCDITLPTAFTPDGDGVNETWQIVDLDIIYPDNVVRVYNRWGNLIFEHDSSKDGAYSTKEWDGTYKGEALPVGSYYFVIEFNNDDKDSSTGTVSILKK